MKRTRVKVCGITSIEDATFAADIGVDAIGLVFYSKSPRYVDPLIASKIAVAVGPFVSVVALFVNEPADQVKKIINHPRQMKEIMLLTKKIVKYLMIKEK